MRAAYTRPSSAAFARRSLQLTEKIAPVAIGEGLVGEHGLGIEADLDDLLQRGRLTLNFAQMRATIINDGRQVSAELTAKEFRLVATLAAQEGQVFSRAQLVKEVWGDDLHVVNRTIDSHICGARRKLGTAGDYIQSVTGTGYRFLVLD